MTRTHTRSPRRLVAQAAGTAIAGALASLALAGCASSNAPAASNMAPVKPLAAASFGTSPTSLVTPPVAPASAVAATESTTPAAAASVSEPAPSPTASPSPTAPAVVPVAAGTAPHFATPDDAMRYLVAAYNAHDMAAEMHVTTPDSRSALEVERQWVQTFSFHSCTPNAGAGDYSCRFDMTSMVPGLAIPSASAATDSEGDGLGNTPAAMNEITVLVAPAARPGWYMYFNMGCGGG